jgi:hypothetical protein
MVEAELGIAAGFGPPRLSDCDDARSTPAAVAKARDPDDESAGRAGRAGGAAAAPAPHQTYLYVSVERRIVGFLLAVRQPFAPPSLPSEYSGIFRIRIFRIVGFLLAVPGPLPPLSSLARRQHPYVLVD